MALSSLPYNRCKRLIPGAFYKGFIGSTWTALPVYCRIMISSLLPAHASSFASCTHRT